MSFEGLYSRSGFSAATARRRMDVRTEKRIFMSWYGFWSVLLLMWLGIVIDF